MAEINYWSFSFLQLHCKWSTTITWKYPLIIPSQWASKKKPPQSLTESSIPRSSLGHRINRSLRTSIFSEIILFNQIQVVHKLVVCSTPCALSPPIHPNLKRNVLLIVRCVFLTRAIIHLLKNRLLRSQWTGSTEWLIKSGYWQSSTLSLETDMLVVQKAYYLLHVRPWDVNKVNGLILQW